MIARVAAWFIKPEYVGKHRRLSPGRGPVTR